MNCANRNRPGRRPGFCAAGLAVLAAGAWAGLVFIAGGCTSSGETAQRDMLTAHVGSYSPPPAVAVRPRVGVPPFSVQAAHGWGGGGSDLNSLAADQMSTLLDQTGRFSVIERTQLQKLLDEQNLEGIVRPGELAKPGRVRGVDYLLLGKVTNLRVKREQTSAGLGGGQDRRAD